jgi:hypothetical protein
MGKVRIFTSFDLENDRDLHDRLVEQSSRLNAGFEISACSEPRTLADPWDESVRGRIRDADEVIVICGKHTEDSLRVGVELRIAQEEEKPYFLLWGRRESMCTRPSGAKPADAMYSWTWEILRSQIVATNRRVQSEKTARVLAGLKT